ncbi:3-phosphoshikimate 1-carboxyvinyltransferase [Natronoglycomyces albus]|uniref:3-phosphoshikimate 1-carboxyvinyltransferase n=1 Tax=Natronoglycomyces albus TaxID=2811108 RepID=A0A895XF33_9ACTN|nr:3-phosphoshikimate 1-carboxyvinyltransferase [Natronoglycomyces albus]QSB04451.1 3-phosphoshikimate 1-carboxyvinyltransferase [Natronoglycomyces albus]
MTDTAAPAEQAWTAPTATRPLNARVRLPGSKSQMARALILTATATSPSTIVRPLYSRDSLLMVEAMRSLGARIDTTNEDRWTVEPATFDGDVDIDCGLSGTVMRFVPPVAALAHGQVRFDGDPHARKRPNSGVIAALRALGVTVEDGGEAALPFTVLGKGTVRGGEVIVDASQTSQLISGLLLAAPRFEQGIDIRHEGPPVPSAPYLHMAAHMLREAGAEVEISANRWRVSPARLPGREWIIEPDLQNAAPFLAAPLIAGGSVTVEGWPQTTTQPGALLPDILADMGAQVSRDEDALTVTGGTEISGIDLDLSHASELTPTLAALCAFADGPSHIQGVAHIRGHETDRIAALARELSGAGSEVLETDDGLIIHPQPLRDTTFHTYADHRIAHAGALLGLGVDGVELTDVACTSKTMPEFVAVWESMMGARP